MRFMGLQEILDMPIVCVEATGHNPIVQRVDVLNVLLAGDDREVS